MAKIPEESQFYDIRMRGTCPDLGSVKLYTDRNRFDANRLVSFDIEYKGYSSISYFLGALLSSVILTTIRELKTHHIELDEIEGVIDAQLSNPLRMVPVCGLDGPTDIKNITIKLYYYADGDEKHITKLIQDSQCFNPIYRLVEKSTPIHLQIEWVL